MDLQGILPSLTSNVNWWVFHASNTTWLTYGGDILSVHTMGCEGGVLLPIAGKFLFYLGASKNHVLSNYC